MPSDRTSDELSRASGRNREAPAREKRNWVRLDYRCNNRCLFCLDSDVHTGEDRPVEEVRAEILDGRRKGATRLVLSGGEPTVHRHFVDFVRLARIAGYEWIQAVTNGRLFRYEEFLDRCVTAGLSELTFSVHGPNAEVHDALVGVRGAFEQTTAGLKNALAGGRLVVNVDVVLNGRNVPHLREMLELFLSWGVSEFDLLQVVPFGRAYAEGRETLFYDLEEMGPHLREALSLSRREGVRIWTNRLPPPHLEGFEELIQDPYKIHDEVRGRREEFERYLDEDVPLACEDPAGRCRLCFLESFCGELRRTKAMFRTGGAGVLRVDAGAARWEPPAFGGDPATARRSAARPKREAAPDARKRPADSPVGRLWLVAPALEEARALAREFPNARELELQLEDYRGLASALEGDRLDGRRLAACVASDAAQARELSGLPESVELVVLLGNATAPWLLGLACAPRRMALRMPTWEGLAEARDNDVDLTGFFGRFRVDVPVEGVPGCVLGREPRAPRAVLDAAMLGPDGRLEIHRFAARYIQDLYFTKSLRCRACSRDPVCRGLHINHVRARGYGEMQPRR